MNRQTDGALSPFSKRVIPEQVPITANASIYLHKHAMKTGHDDNEWEWLEIVILTKDSKSSSWSLTMDFDDEKLWQTHEFLLLECGFVDDDDATMIMPHSMMVSSEKLASWKLEVSSSHDDKTVISINYCRDDDDISSSVMPLKVKVVAVAKRAFNEDLNPEDKMIVKKYAFELFLQDDGAVYYGLFVRDVLTKNLISAAPIVAVTLFQLFKNHTIAYKDTTTRLSIPSVVLHRLLNDKASVNSHAALQNALNMFPHAQIVPLFVRHPLFFHSIMSMEPCSVCGDSQALYQPFWNHVERILRNNAGKELDPRRIMAPDRLNDDNVNELFDVIRGLTQAEMRHHWLKSPISKLSDSNVNTFENGLKHILNKDKSGKLWRKEISDMLYLGTEVSMGWRYREDWRWHWPCLQLEMEMGMGMGGWRWRW